MTDQLLFKFSEMEVINIIMLIVGYCVIVASSSISFSIWTKLSELSHKCKIIAIVINTLSISSAIWSYLWLSIIYRELTIDYSFNYLTVLAALAATILSILAFNLIIAKDLQNFKKTILGILPLSAAILLTIYSLLLSIKINGNIFFQPLSIIYASISAFTGSTVGLVILLLNAKNTKYQLIYKLFSGAIIAITTLISFKLAIDGTYYNSNNIILPDHGDYFLEEFYSLLISYIFLSSAISFWYFNTYQIPTDINQNIIKFRLRVKKICMFFISLIIVSLVASSITFHNKTDKILETNNLHNNLYTNLIYYDQILTMYCMMAVSTKDLSWHDRYYSNHTKF